MSWNMFRAFMARFGFTWDSTKINAILRPIYAKYFVARRTYGTPAVTTDFPLLMSLAKAGVADPLTGVLWSWENDLGFDVAVPFFALSTTVGTTAALITADVGVGADLAHLDSSIAAAFPVDAAGEADNLGLLGLSRFITVPAGEFLAVHSAGDVTDWEGSAMALLVPVL